MAKGVQFTAESARRIGRATKIVESLKATEQRLYNRFVTSHSASRIVVAVVIACERDTDSGSVLLTCSRLTGLPYTYDPDPVDADKFIAWGGIDPLIVLDSIVWLQQCVTIPDNPEIGWIALPMLSVNPTTLDMPDMDCLTAYTEPCSTGNSTDLCM